MYKRLYISTMNNEQNHTYSLKQDLNISKVAIRKAIDQFAECADKEDERWEEAMDAMTLLHIRGDRYTKEEASALIAWYVTPHDECVIDNAEDYSNIEVYTAEKKEQRLWKAMQVLEN